MQNTSPASFPMPFALPERFIDARAAGEFLTLHPVTVQRLARKGELPGHAVCNGKRKHWRFLQSELAAWLKNR
jgi:excisionase family DNA binding protein